MTLLKKYFLSATFTSTAVLSLMVLIVPTHAQDLVFPTVAIDEEVKFPQAPVSPQAKVVAPAPSFNKAPQKPFVAKKPVMPPVPNYRRNMPNQAMRTPPSAYQNYYPKNQNQYQYRNQNQAQARNYPRYPRNNTNNNNNNSFPFSNNMPFGNNSNNGFNPFNNGNMPFSGNSFSNPMNNMFGNNNSGNMPFFGNSNSNRKKAWGNKRNIWPDFYTDFTDEAWDTITSGPRDLGTMPGGWRFPHISTPDPVTVSDAITNQFPPIAEEAGNMMDFSDWGVFD